MKQENHATHHAHERAERFRTLHEGPEILLLPGVWDVVSARIFAAEGFPALGTTSAGICWSVGREHGWPAFLEASKRIADSVPIPVSFDIESGFSDQLEGIVGHVSQVIDAGACGINIEDGFADGTLVDPQRHVERLEAIRTLCKDRDYPLFINARTDVFLGGSEDLGEAIDRCNRYVDAGADGVFVPGLMNGSDIAEIAKEVAVPVNIYALPGVPSPAMLLQMGARRISLGCGPQQSALAHVRSLARSLKDHGDYRAFTDNWMSYEDAEQLCS